MIKQTPSLGRLVAMAVFGLSCFGILLFLWLAFGGTIPLRPESYRFEVAIPESATLAKEADVRLAGVNVGKVKDKALDKRGARTIVTIELKSQYAPIPRDSRVILRSKTLLGETYVGLAQGHKSAGILPDGGRLPNVRVQPTVELDEIFSSFDRPTREAFREWVAELSKAIRGRASEDLNDAFGNLSGFAVDGAKLLRVLDEQGVAVRRLVRNTGEVFGAINERQGALRQLIVNSNNTFEALASRDRALAETFRVFPTFLDESKVTMARLERFSRNTRPLVNDLKRPADDLGPTVRDLGRLAPDLEALFRDLDPVIRVSKRTVPDLRRFLDGAEPVLEAINPWFDQLNPILSYLSFHQRTIAGFITNGGTDLAPDKVTGRAKQTQIGIINGRSFEQFKTIPEWQRGNAYVAPNAYDRGVRFGTLTESILCPNGKEVKDAVDFPAFGEDKMPPCFNAPPSLYNGQIFPRLEKGKAPKVPAPKDAAGTTPADPNR